MINKKNLQYFGRFVDIEFSNVQKQVANKIIAFDDVK